MAQGQQRTMMARGAAGLGFLCGVIGLVAGLLDHTWKLKVAGWFTGGALLTLLAVFALIDGALAARPR
jgi:hypothetical protein